VNFSVLILAGGRSSRMGTNKALVSFNGRPLVSYPIRLAANYQAPVLLIDNSDDLVSYGFPVIRDIYPVGAPMAGIHAGLNASTTKWNLVLSCDMPNVSAALIDLMVSKLADAPPILVPRHNGFTEPLCGFYHKSLLPLLSDYLEKGSYKLMELIRLFPGTAVSIDESLPLFPKDIFLNINHPGDLIPEN
jgi:molybdopterin-guanine dinucleotide biosynthesis protein A